LARAHKALTNYKEVYTYFQKKVGQPSPGTKTYRKTTSKGFMSVMEPTAQYVTKKGRRRLKGKERETADTYNFLLLAYLDSAGYSERSGRKAPLDQFKAILERYLFVVEKIQNVLKGVESDLAEAVVLEGDARALSLEDSSVDGIIFSPPYSFAIDYLKNDSFHLNFMGVDTDKLRDKMIGLRGRKLSEKFEIYQEDMEKVLSECARVLRPGRLCTIIVGTNNNQLSKAFGVSPDEVLGLHEILADLGSKHGLQLVKMISRSITGISNTMRREYIVMLRRL